MGAEIVIIITLVLFTAALTLGLHIHTTLFAVGIVGILLLDGPSVLNGLLGVEPYTRVSSYSLSTIPLFILMAQFVLQAGVVQDVFAVVSRISRGRLEPLSGLTIAAGGMLGAVSGSGSATSAALGRVALPELHRYGMSKALAGATAAAAGSLAGIIPPSIILIIYGVATETPIGDLFLGALLPGIATMVVFIVVITLMYWAEVRKSGVERKPFEPERIGARRTAISLFAGFAIVLVIFGGIYTGVFTPTEAGAVGALAGFVAALALGRVNREFLRTALLETVKISTMVLFIIMAAQVFSKYISLSLLPRRIIELLDPLVQNPVLLLAVLAVIFFVLFMFLEGAAVILMSVPILLPVMQAAEIDLLWFGVFVSFLCTIGTLSPPVGLCVFAVSGATRVPSTTIFRPALVIAAATSVVMVILLIAYPQLVSFVPSISG